MGKVCECLFLSWVGAHTAEACSVASRKEKFSRIQKFCPLRMQLFRAARFTAGTFAREKKEKTQQP